MDEGLDDGWCYGLGDAFQIGLTGARHRMWQAHAGCVRHAKGVGHEVALGPKLVGHQGYRWDAQTGDCNAVTHGAGGATASVPVGGDRGVAAVADFIQHALRRGG